MHLLSPSGPIVSADDAPRVACRRAPSASDSMEEKVDPVIVVFSDEPETVMNDVERLSVLKMQFVIVNDAVD